MVARTRIPPPPIHSEDRTIWSNWYVAVKNAINNLRADLKWINLDFTGSNITDIASKSHQALDNLQGGSSTERYHVSATQATAIAAFNATQWTDLTDGGGTTLHTHTHNSNTSMQGGTTNEYYHLTSAQHSGLTGGGTTTLHNHRLTATATLNFPSISSNGIEQLTVTVTGAVAGSPVMLGPPAAIEAGLTWSGYVSAADTVTIRLHNNSAVAVDPASATWTVSVHD